MNISYFASIREAIGKPQESLDLPDHVGTVAQLIDWLATINDSYQRAFADRDAVNIAINETLASPQDLIRNNDSIALFPPMTGG